MPKQYAFKIWRAGKSPCTYYNICANETAAVAWINAMALEKEWGEPCLDWEIQSMTSRPISEVYDDFGDKVGYLNEIAAELFVREVSCNCPDAQFRGLSWVDLCEAAIEILEVLKGEG